MNSIGKENITQLTKNGIKDLIEKRKKKIVVQVLELQKLNKKDAFNQNSDKFRVVISDGDAKHRCILGNQAAKAAEESELKEFSVIQANEHLYNNHESKNPIIIITEIEVIYSSVNERIGNPDEWNVYQQNGYQNPAGSNQIPVKYLDQQKPPTAKQTINRNMGSANPTATVSSTTATNTIQMNQKKPINTAQPQNNTSSTTTKPISGPISNNQSKSSRSGSEAGFQIQNTNNTMVVSKANTTAATTSNQNTNNTTNPSLNYQRSGSFGNPNSSISTLTSSRNAGGNKAIDYKASTKRLSELSRDDFIPIRALVGYSSGFTIKAKVTKKSELRSYEKGGNPSQVFSIELVDEDGGEIQGTFFGDAANENYQRIQENRVYAFSGGTIKLANTRFQTVKNDYQIIFDKTSQIEEMQDDGSINAQSFKFTPLSEIENIDVNTNIDVLALVKDVGACNDIILKKGDTKARRILELYDSTLYTVELTLWGDLAKSCAPKRNDVVVGRGLRVSEFLNKKNLSYGSTSSQLYWGDSLPKIPEIQDLIKWRDSTHIDESEFVHLSRAGDRIARYCKTLDQIEDECATLQDDRKYFDVRVYISHIKTDNNMYYYACSNEKCLKKLSGDDHSGWTCFNCNNKYSQPSLRYTLSLKIEDNTNTVWVTAFSKEAELIMNASAEHVRDLKDLGEDIKLADLVKEACCYEWRMRLSAKQDLINGEARIRYQVLKCNKLDFVTESKSLLKILDLY